MLPYSRRINIFIRIRKEENENMINRCSLYFYSTYFLNLLMLRLKNKEYENIKFSIYKKRKKIHNYSFLKIRSYPLFKNYEIENENENINK